MLRIAILIVAFGVVGCAQQPKSEPVVDKKFVAGFLYSVRAHQVKDGMTEDEVISIMGASPDSRSEMNTQEGKVQSLGWRHYNQATGKIYSVTFSLLNNKVNGRSETGL